MGSIDGELKLRRVTDVEAVPRGVSPRLQMVQTLAMRGGPHVAVLGLYWPCWEKDAGTSGPLISIGSARATE